MRNTNKKGFTIVELVIVVAVIAILAAVLIPTFSGIIKKAQYSADQKAEKDMNTALAIEMNPKNLDDAIDALIENGFNGKNLVPVSAGYSYVWSKADYKIYLVKNEEITDNHINLAEGEKYIDIVAKTEAEFLEAVANGSKNIKLETDVVLNAALVIFDELELDLNGKKITTETYVDGSNVKHHYIEVYGALTLTGGEIEGRGVWVKDNAELTVKNTKISAIDPNGGAAININPGAKVVIESGEFYAKAANSMLDGASVVMNQGCELTINGGKFESTANGPYVLNHKNGTTVVNGGEFIAVRGVATAISGSLTINNGSFTVREGGAAYPIHAGGTGVVVVNAGVKLNGGANTACVSPAKEGTTTGNITLKVGVIVDANAITEEVHLVIDERYN